VRLAVWLMLLGMLGTHQLAAQIDFEPAPPLDSARAALRDVLQVLRDSLVTIDGAAGRLQRDYRAASGPSLLSRARVMRDACARSIRTIPPTREAVLATNLSDPGAFKQRRKLVGALDSLTGVLRWCETEFAAMSQPDQAETVRGYANDRAVRVQGALRRYEQTLRDFVGVIGIPLTPLGVNPATVAS
jgi:hypothetical protein